MKTNLLTEISESVLNQALQSEFTAFYLYRHIALQCQKLGLFGAQKFFSAESDDEQAHAKRIENYFNDRGSVAALPAIESPDVEINGLLDAIKAGYKVETDLGNQYAKAYSLVLAKDPTTAQFLLESLEIQRLSIGEYGDWVARLELVGDDKCGVLMIDKELGN